MYFLFIRHDRQPVENIREHVCLINFPARVGIHVSTHADKNNFLFCVFALVKQNNFGKPKCFHCLRPGAENGFMNFFFIRPELNL